LALRPIGINDQPRALVGLPVSKEPEAREEPGPNAAKASWATAWQRAGCPCMASGVT